MLLVVILFVNPIAIISYLHCHWTRTFLSKHMTSPAEYARPYILRYAFHLENYNEHEYELSSESVIGNVSVLLETDHYVVVDKPPGVVCHHSSWTGSRKSDYPMLQRVRQAFGGRHVNLIHRLDRGASGCLLLAFSGDRRVVEDATKRLKIKNNTLAETDITSYQTTTTSIDTTALLNEAMTSCRSQKTYIALVRGAGILHGRDLTKDGWFVIDRPIKNERGILKNATTWFRFVAGQNESYGGDHVDSETVTQQPRSCIVLARPLTGRWHQIRRHLNGLSHPILGDSSHGNTATNREWRLQRGLLFERTCLHLAQIKIPPIESVCPDGIIVNCNVPPDMMRLLDIYLPETLKVAAPTLLEEGIHLSGNSVRDVLFFEKN
jgi:tRNA pseudouridine65 synthase